MSRASTILIVDDDPHIRMLIKSTLDDGSRHIFEAATAIDGLHIANTVFPDILLLDISLAGAFDGFTLQRVLSDDPRHRHMVVIIISGYKDRDSVDEAARLGAHIYMMKPFSPATLTKRIEELEAVATEFSVEIPAGEASENMES